MTDLVTVPGFYGYTGATLHLAIDETERQRRQEAGLGAIGSPDVLAVLMALPHGEPIPWQNLTRYQQHVVRRAPAGVFAVVKTSRTRGFVTRLAVRPCRIVRATGADGHLEMPERGALVAWAFDEQAYHSYLTYATPLERTTTPCPS